MTGLSTHTAKRKVEGKNVGRGMQASRHTHTLLATPKAAILSFPAF